MERLGGARVKFVLNGRRIRTGHHSQLELGRRRCRSDVSSIFSFQSVMCA